MDMKMMERGFAFPRQTAEQGHGGMTLRDYFAAAAVTGLCTNHETAKLIGEEKMSLNTAALAYKMADALIEARGT